MTLLRDHLKRSQSTEEGVRDYVVDVSARYPSIEKTTWGLRQQVACHWRVGYVTRSDAVVSLLMMPFWLLGHVTARSSYMDFTTYHYLTVPEVRSLRQRRMLKYFLLPFVIFALVMTGIALLIGLIVTVVMVFHLGPPEEDNRPTVMAPVVFAACLIFLGLFLFASLKAQRRLYKMGQPPHADEFQDQQILLKAVDIK
jgi:ABC-type xylose transport system permease subunit